MVDTAPLPPDFPAPIDADTLPVRAAHPLEQWAEPAPAFERIIRKPLEGGGYLDASETALRNLIAAQEEAAARRATIKRPEEIAREQAAREAAAETERKASNPLAVLRMSHTLQAEAQQSVDQLQPALSRARQLVEDFERQQREYAEAVAVGDQAAAARLIEALAAGTDAPPMVDVDHHHRDVADELRTARTALAQLEAKDKAARDRLARCQYGVARSAVAVLVNQAADEANAILETTAALDQRRADLDELGKLLTNEAHRLNGHPPRLPPQISRALYPADRVLVGTANAISATDWRRVYQALIEDPGEHEIGPVSDSVEVEAS